MNAPSRVRPITPPSDSLIADWYADADLLDSYAVELPPGSDGSMAALARRALGAPPAWLRALLDLRDAIVGPLGIKTSARLRQARPAAGRIDFFPVLEERADEIVLGEDDRHLNFRLSLLRRRHAHGVQVIATTAVRINNRLGRAYILVIAPFHHLVVRSSLASLRPARGDD